MADVNLKGLDAIPMNYASRKTALRESFNQKLTSLVEEWQQTAANTYVNASGVRGFSKITTLRLLGRESSGTRGTIRASVSLLISPVSLTAFFVEQQRLTVGMAVNQASMKRGKYKEKAAKDGLIFTRAKVLRSGKPKLVQVKNKKGFLSKAEGLKGFMYSPTNRDKAKPETPLGVYVRLQQETWKEGKRLPTAKIYAPPLAILMFSKRVRNRIKLEKRLGGLLD